MRRETFKIQPIDTETDVAIGVKLPFSTKQGGLFELSYTTEDQAISNLKSLLLTKKGERMMRPNFGTGLWQKLFEKNTEDFKPLLEREMRNDISYWLPYIIIYKLDITNANTNSLDVNEHGISITLHFRVTEQGANQTITLNATTSGAITLS